MKKREYSFGEHKLQNLNQSILAPQDFDYFGHLTSQNQRVFSPPAGSGRTSPYLIAKQSKSPMKNEFEDKDVSQMQKLEKLVKHRHKLSHLIKDSIQRDAQKKHSQIQQNSTVTNQELSIGQANNVVFSVSKEPIFLPGSVYSSIRPQNNIELISCNDTFQQQFEEILSPLSGAGEYSDFTSLPPSPLKPQTAHEQDGNRQRSVSQAFSGFSEPSQSQVPPFSNIQARSVIIINPSIQGVATNVKPSPQTMNAENEHLMKNKVRKVLANHQEEKMSSLGIGRNAGHIIEEILARNGTEDENNYLKFVVSEMKPNYRDQQVVLIGEQQIKSNQRLYSQHNATPLSQSPIQLGSGNLQNDQLTQSDEDCVDILDFAKLHHIKSDDETLECDIEKALNNGDTTPQIIKEKSQQPRARSQAIGKRSLAKKSGNKGSFRNEILQKNDQSPKSVNKNPRKETQGSLFNKSVAQPANRCISANDEKAKSVVSDSMSQTRKQEGVFSDRGGANQLPSFHEDSTSQYQQLKQIKFKLKIMKHPEHITLPVALDKKKKAKTRAHSKQEHFQNKHGDTAINDHDGDKTNVNDDVIAMLHEGNKNVKKKFTMIDLTYIEPVKKIAGRNLNNLPNNQKSGTKGKLHGTQEKTNINQDINKLEEENKNSQVIDDHNVNLEIELKLSQMASAQEKESQQTVYASSGAPLNSKLDSIYKKGLINQDIGKKDMPFKMFSDGPNSVVNIRLSLSQNGDRGKIFEEIVIDTAKRRQRELPGSNFDIKSGGEIGNGLFSSHLTEQRLEDSESELKTAYKLRKSAYQVISSPNVASFNKKSATKMPSRDMKERHLRLVVDRGSKSTPNKDQQDNGSAIKTVIPTIDNFKKEDCEDHHDTLLSIQSSESSSEKLGLIPHILLVDDAKEKCIDLEKSNDAMIQFQDLYLKDSNYLMRYGEALQSKSNSQKDDANGNPVSTNGDYVDEKDLGIQTYSGVFKQQLSENDEEMISYQNQPAKKKKKSPKNKNGRTRIEKIQKMNQNSRPKTGDLGLNVLQGRPIKPIRQIIRDNIIAIATMHSGNQKVPHQICVNLLGTPKIEGTPENSKQIFQEEEDVNLQKYLWNTLHQLKNEGYPIDFSLFTPYHSRQHTPSPSRQGNEQNSGNVSLPFKNDDANAFSNKRIKNAHSRLMAHLTGSSDRPQKNSARMNFDRVKKSTMAVNADLIQYTYIEDQLDKESARIRKSPMISQRTTRVPEKDINKITDNSIIRSDDDRNVGGDTMNSNPGTHRNSFIKPVQPKYALDSSLNNALSLLKTEEKESKNEDIKHLEEVLAEQVSFSNENQMMPKKNFGIGKTLPFDLHLMRLNSPNLPAPLLSPEGQKIISDPKNNAQSKIQPSFDLQNQMNFDDNKQRRNIVIGRKTESAQFEKPFPNNFFEKRRSEHYHDQQRINAHSQPPRSDLNLDSNNNETVSRRPSNISKFPNAIEGVYIKTYDAVQNSHESQTLSEAMKGSIFFSNHPGLFSEQIRAQTVMSMRNKKRRILTNTHFQSTNKGKDPISEYAGGEIKIKQLQAMRKPDPTLIPPNIDYQDYFKPLKTSWAPMITHKRAQSHAREYRFNQTRPDISRGTVLRPFTGFMTPTQQQNFTSPPSRTSEIMSPHQRTQSPSTILNSPPSIYRVSTSLSQTRPVQQKPLFKIKKGRVLEATTLGVKPSDGYKII